MFRKRPKIDLPTGQFKDDDMIGTCPSCGRLVECQRKDTSTKGDFQDVPSTSCPHPPPENLPSSRKGKRTSCGARVYVTRRAAPKPPTDGEFYG